MTEIKKLSIIATLSNGENVTKKDDKGQKILDIEALGEKLSDLKVEIADLVDKKIEQYHRKQNKH
jgi:hypothetical protein